MAAIVADIAAIDAKSKVLADNSAMLPRTTIYNYWWDDWVIIAPECSQVSCSRVGVPQLMQIQLACRVRQFPGFGCTNAIFILISEASNARFSFAQAIL